MYSLFTWLLFGILIRWFIITTATILFQKAASRGVDSILSLSLLLESIRPFIVVIEDSLEKFLQGFPPLSNLLEILLLLFDVSSSDGTGLDGRRLRGIALISVLLD